MLKRFFWVTFSALLLVITELQADDFTDEELAELGKLSFYCDLSKGATPIKFSVEAKTGKLMPPYSKAYAQFDGAWINVNINDDTQFAGISRIRILGSNGDIIISKGQEQVREASVCKIYQRAEISDLPKSDDALLRKYFVDLAEADRLNLHRLLKEENFYNSSIDGLWGKNTSIAFKKYFAANELDISNVNDIEQAFNLLQVLEEVLPDYAVHRLEEKQPKIDAHKPFDRFGNTFSGTLSFKNACITQPGVLNDEEFCYKPIKATLTFPTRLGENWSSNGKASIQFTTSKKQYSLQFAGVHFDYAHEINGDEFNLSANSNFSKLDGTVYVSAGNYSLPVDVSFSYQEHKLMNWLLIQKLEFFMSDKYQSVFIQFPEQKRRNIQQNLANTGYYNGKVDGYWDDELFKATLLALTENYAGSQFITESWDTKKWFEEQLTYLTAENFREKYDASFAWQKKQERDARKVRQEEELKRKQEEQKRKEEERKKKAEEVARLKRLALDKAREDFNAKVASFNKQQAAIVKSNFGFRGLIPGMTKEAITKECGRSVGGSSSRTACYSLDNISFFGEYSPITIKSERFDREQVSEKIQILNMLTVDLGPITQSLFIDALTFYKTDPDAGNILSKMYQNLKKYKLEFEYSERDRELFNEGLKDELYVVYEGGKVALKIERIKKDYSSDNWLFVEYRSDEVASAFLERNRPKRAAAGDF